MKIRFLLMAVFTAHAAHASQATTLPKPTAQEVVQFKQNNIYTNSILRSHFAVSGPHQNPVVGGCVVVISKPYNDVVELTTVSINDWQGTVWLKDLLLAANDTAKNNMHFVDSYTACARNPNKVFCKTTIPVAMYEALKEQFGK